MSPTILVVDDEPDLESLITQKFRRQIRKGEFRFLFAHDGLEALKVLQDSPEVDVVLSDINMPRMDGLTLLQHLSELDMQLRAVIVSAYGDMSNIRTAMNRGAFDFVTKPIDLDDLQITIQKTLADLEVLRDALQRKDMAEKAKANLARYFPDSLVEELAERDDPFDGVRSEKVAILFADIVGFTTLAAGLPPKTTFELLRQFHDIMGKTAFAHNGIVDKYMGDGLMCSFGIPAESDADASNALRCARDMMEAIRELNEEESFRNLPPIRIALGIHYGEVLMGNIGNERRLEFATLGDTVNVASRMESLARPLNADIVLSEAACEAIKAEGNGELLAGFIPSQSQDIRRGEELASVFYLPHQEKN